MLSEKFRNRMNRLDLWETIPPRPALKTDFVPFMELYPIETDKPLGAVLICPGGAYHHRSAHEGEIIARKFNETGLHAFVVQYRITPDRHPAPLEDAVRALKIIRFNAAKWKVKPNKIAICGFSAGGHLAGTVGLYHNKTTLSCDEIDKMPSRPDALIFSYPVLTSGMFTHKDSFKNLLGENLPQKNLELLSLENNVTKDVPPSFLWHTANDEGVPVETSLLFAIELSKHKVPFELHIYPDGMHGLGLATELSRVVTWFGLCREWLRSMGWQ